MRDGTEPSTCRQSQSRADARAVRERPAYSWLMSAISSFRSAYGVKARSSVAATRGSAWSGGRRDLVRVELLILQCRNYGC